VRLGVALAPPSRTAKGIAACLEMQVQAVHHDREVRGSTGGNFGSGEVRGNVGEMWEVLREVGFP
jgi:hypothetical protein